MANIQNDSPVLNTSHLLAAFSPATLKIKEYTIPGSYSVTIPLDVNMITVTACGAGGKGGPGNAGYTTGPGSQQWGGGGSGGGGANMTTVNMEVTPGSTISLTVGNYTTGDGEDTLFGNYKFLGGLAGTPGIHLGYGSAAPGVAGIISDLVEGGSNSGFKDGYTSSFGIGGITATTPSAAGQPGGISAGGGAGCHGIAPSTSNGATGISAPSSNYGAGGGGGGGGGGAGASQPGGVGGNGGTGYISIVYLSKDTI